MKFSISSPFGVIESIRNGRQHLGIDLAMPEDTPLRSFCNGTVEKVMDFGNDNIGKGVMVKAANGVRYLYGHMNEIDVTQGQAVHAGTLLGLSGSTGHSTGPHLHFSETVDGRYVDPSNVIQKVDATAGGPAPQNWWQGIAGKLDVQSQIEDHVNTVVQHVIIGALSAAGAVAMHMLYSVALVGGGVLIVMKTLGFEHRWLRPSVLVGAYVLLRYLFGGD